MKIKNDKQTVLLQKAVLTSAIKLFLTGGKSAFKEVVQHLPEDFRNDLKIIIDEISGSDGKINLHK